MSKKTRETEAKLVLALTDLRSEPPSREVALAITKVQEAIFWLTQVEPGYTARPPR